MTTRTWSTWLIPGSWLAPERLSRLKRTPHSLQHQKRPRCVPIVPILPNTPPMFISSKSLRYQSDHRRHRIHTPISNVARSLHPSSFESWPLHHFWAVQMPSTFWIPELVQSSVFNWLGKIKLSPAVIPPATESKAR